MNDTTRDHELPTVTLTLHTRIGHFLFGVVLVARGRRDVGCWPGGA